MLKHISVLKEASIEALNIKSDGIYVDATLGGAGHSYEIAKRLTTGHLYAFDQDLYAIGRAKEVLKDFNNVTIFHANFSELKEKLLSVGVHKIDGILFDLGLSSFQIDDRKRGFSYLSDETLDMRMNQNQTLTAKEVVNTYEEKQLTRIFQVYGEEKNGFYITKEILKKRPLETTKDLVDITDKVNYKVKGHSAKRVFQALRIEVNKELEVLEKALDQVIDLLNPKGRLSVITFHSLEDRITKHFMKENSSISVPKNMPLINIPKPPLNLVTRKAILPTEEELALNPRSHSAKLRVAERSEE